MVTRETKIIQSVEDYVRNQVFSVAGFAASDVRLLDAFPHTRFDEPMDKTYVCCGFNFDDGGRQAELGSNLKVRNYTITFYVFGRDPAHGEAVVHAVKSGAEAEGIIPLYDYGNGEPPPQLDALVVTYANAQRQFLRDPRPWEENVYTATVKVEDTYSPPAG